MRLTRLSSLAIASLMVVGSPILAHASNGSTPVRGGHYSGKVGPGYPISFKVSANGKSVDDLVVGFEATCNGPGPETAPLIHFGTLKIKDGKFSGSLTKHFGKKASEALHVSASFHGQEATGKVADTSKITSLPTCSESDPFTAKAK